MLTATLSEKEVDVLRKHLPILINSLDKGITDLNLEIAARRGPSGAGPKFVAHQRALLAEQAVLAGIFAKL